MDPLNNKCECPGSKLLISNADVYWGQTHVTRVGRFLVRLVEHGRKESNSATSKVIFNSSLFTNH